MGVKTVHVIHVCCVSSKLLRYFGTPIVGRNNIKVLVSIYNAKTLLYMCRFIFFVGGGGGG